MPILPKEAIKGVKNENTQIFLHYEFYFGNASQGELICIQFAYNLHIIFLVTFRSPDKRKINVLQITVIMTIFGKFHIKDNSNQKKKLLVQFVKFMNPA